MEYDTYRDPAGPISASAQVLFGAISNFVIGLADVPAEMLSDLISAGKQLGHNHPAHHPDPRLKWHKREPHNNDEVASEEGSEEQINQQKNQNSGETMNNSVQEPMDNALAQNGNGTRRKSQREDGSDGEDSVSASSELVPEAGLDRVRSLQLEKSQTMSSEISPSKAHGFFGEVGIHGGNMSKRFANFMIWLPTDFSLSLSKGFHNAPKLYHDSTVKPTPKVHGVRSGFRAARHVRFPLSLIFLHITDSTAGITRWILLRRHWSGHSTSTWIQRDGYKGDDEGGGQRSCRCLFQTTSWYAISFHSLYDAPS